MGTNTGLGIGIGIPFKNNALGGDKPYFPPELKARMIGVWTNYGKKNTDTDRNIIKNKIPNAGGDLEILNAAYKLNSGFGEYSEDFTTWTKSSKITSVDSESFDFVTNVNWNLLYYKSNIGKDIPSFKVRIKLKGEGKVFYNYITSEGVYTNEAITSEEYITPISYNTKYTGETPVNCGFTIGISNECSGTITQIPNFEDAFVTDGVNDLIISQKTVKEMIGDNGEITVISMVYYINTDVPARISITNDVRGMTAEDKSSQVFARNAVKIEGVGKLGIYGWSKKGASTTVYPYFNILGDKTDYGVSANYGLTDDAKFCPVGEPSLRFMSKQAHYWSFMVIGKLTEDEINLIIGNYNLDRSLKPDILCNIGKQGITNENHAEFNDKLIDYSGNGRDIQMYNLAWKGGSGVAAKQYESLKDWRHTPFAGTTVIRLDEFSYNIVSNNGGYWQFRVDKTNEPTSQIRVITDRKVTWINNIKYAVEGESSHKDKYKTTIIEANTPTIINIAGFDFFDPIEGGTFMSVLNYGQVADDKGYTLTILPSCKGGILLDGVNDFGKVTGMPIYKDYTVIVERAITSNRSGIVSKVKDSNNYGAFILELDDLNYSFNTSGTRTTNIINDRKITYLSKYVYNGENVNVGNTLDSDIMWLGRVSEGYPAFSNISIYSLMSFPYSMSEFLIERQLKKYKLGTLYPDMVEFRPVIKANANYKITYYQIDSTNTRKSIKVGDYIVIGAKLAFQITFDNDASELKEVVSPQLSGIIVEKRPSNPGYNIYSYITSKSPQKINITIDEYIRFEDIVQPYPVLLRFKDENGNEVSWGGKFRVGSTITRIGSIADPESNLLNGLYSISGLSLNGKAVTSSTSIVEKQMVFRTTATWLLDNNEPKCILSPRLLHIPNSSYKILGHIPDISGHGNHGKINNSAYAEGSGVNEDGSYQFDGVDDFVTIPTLSSGGKQVLMKVNWSKNTFNEILYDQRENLDIHTFAIFNHDSDTVTGESVVAYNSKNNGNTYIDGILNYNIKASELKDIEHNITITNESVNTNNSISPTIGTNKNKDAHYAKMALYDFMLFDNISTEDKIKELNEYVGIEAKVELPPYYFDTHGKTNLDDDRDYIANLGTVQDVIEVSQPAIFAENWYDYYESFVSRSPIINQTDYSIEVKPTHMDNNFNMLLSVNCDTPLPAFRAKFTRTSNVDVSYAEIRYRYYVNGEWTYIDIFGEDNSAESVILDIPASEKSSISGSNVDNFPNILIEVLPADNSVRYGLSNKNFAYDKMSGYGGYSLGRFDKSWSSSSSNNTSVIVVSRNPYDITLKKLGGNSDWEFNNTELKVISNPVSVKFKSNKNIRVTCDYHYYPVGGNSEGTPLGITSKDLIANKDAIITISPISQENIDKYNIDVNRGYYLIYSQLSLTLAVNEEVTIEMLPLYPNGLVYDGVTDYSENVNIPALTDYTYILKRQILKGIANSAVMYKGNITVNQGGAFICNYCEPSDTNLFTDFSFGGLLRSNDIDKPIIYGTKTSVNGDSITPGENINTVGINVGKWVNYLPMVFYKLILYPKTIPLLQINFLKNLMERDEIIDINHPIFISNTEDESNTSQDT